MDVRSAGEFAEQHLDGASNINVDDLPARLGELERERHIVVYCRSGRRSANAAKLLRDSGFTVSDIGRMAQFDERAPAGCAP